MTFISKETFLNLVKKQMVSVGPDKQSLNYTHMSSFVDYRGEKSKIKTTDGTIFNHIYNDPNFSKFSRIIQKASMEGQLDSSQADFTLFAPTDNFLKHIPDFYFDEMDNGLAKQIVNASLLDRKIGKDLITSSPVSYLITRNSRMRMYVTNIRNNTILNECINIVKFDNQFNNGILYIIDNLIQPNLNTFMN